MTSPTRQSPMFSDDEVAAIARRVGPHDHERIAPPSQVWDNIVAELEVEIASSEASARRRAHRRWFPSTQILSIAAAVLVIVGIVGGIALFQTGENPGEQLAAAMMTDDGLPVATIATAQARVVCTGDDCVVEVDFASVPDAGEADLELWVINGDVTDMHSLGLLSESGVFELPDGVTPADFPIVDISIEPRDGIATHSGRSVLRGLFEQA